MFAVLIRNRRGPPATSARAAQTGREIRWPRSRTDPLCRFVLLRGPARDWRSLSLSKPLHRESWAYLKVGKSFRRTKIVSENIRSGQLSYPSGFRYPHVPWYSAYSKLTPPYPDKDGGAGESRTPDQAVRNRLLYPSELQPQVNRVYSNCQLQESSDFTAANEPARIKHRQRGGAGRVRWCITTRTKRSCDSEEFFVS